MKLLGKLRRAAPPAWAWLAVVVWLLACAPAPAQVRPDTVPRDTVRRDTVRVAIPPGQVQSDTVPDDSLRAALPDSLRVVETFPLYPQPLPHGWAFARWELDRAELLRYHGLSLMELLEQVPGLTLVRTGAFGRPAGLTALGLGGANVRVFRDGFEVLPMASATPDLQKIGLVDLEAVRVERVAGEVRVHLTTFRLPDARPFSQVEVAAGNYQIKMLRALLARAVGARSVLYGAYDLATTSGIGIDEAFSFGSGRARWSYALFPWLGLQAEYRLASTERASETVPENSMRRELVLRARSTPLPGLTLDGQVGRIWRRPDEPDAPRRDADDGFGGGVGGGGSQQEEESPDALEVGLTSTQGLLRAGYTLPIGFVEASARVRGGERTGSAAADLELGARAAVQPLPWLTGEAELISESLGGERAAHTRAAARAGPFLGLSLFASAAGGERWRGLARDTTVLRRDTVEVDGQRVVRVDTLRLVNFPAFRAGVGELRAGAEWSGGGVQLGAAAVISDATRFFPLNLHLDRTILPFEVQQASGFEVYGSVPVLPIRAMRLHGWYARWPEFGGRPYLPREQARAVLEYHDIRLEGQFEPTIRLEGTYRGASVGPGADGSAFSEVTDSYAMLNLYVQLRIQDVRAFVTLENLANNRVAADVPGVFLPGPRSYYGIRWHFRN